jgi:hypothetical protein
MSAKTIKTNLFIPNDPRAIIPIETKKYKPVVLGGLRAFNLE